MFMIFASSVFFHELEMVVLEGHSLIVGSSNIFSVVNIVKVVHTTEITNWK